MSLLSIESVRSDYISPLYFHVRYESGELYSTIDSHGCKMKRPTGLAVMQNLEGEGQEEREGRRHVVVVDIGNDCVRKFRYF